MWRVGGRSARAASRSPLAPTTSRPSARPVRRTCSRPCPKRPPCSTPSSHDPPHGPSGGRVRSQGARRPLSARVAAVLRRAVRGPNGPGRPPRPMSASVKIPMPLRVPELAPPLGRVLVPRRLEEPWVPLDDIREELATRVMELGGEARAAAARDDRDRVLDAVSRRAWLAAWEGAVRRAGERVTAALDAEIERAARRVRMPRRRRRRRLLAGSEKRAIAARLAAGGETLVAALDALDAVAGWRPSLWPLVALWTPLAVGLVWLGLVLGGYLPAPAWLAALLGF